MIYIGLGANLPSRQWGAPRATCEAALAAMRAAGIRIVRASGWVRSAPVPASDQPWFVNGVVEVATALDPGALLRRLHRIEEAFGRVRGERNAARVIDLDLLAYGDMVQEAGAWPVLPHPRMHERGFVLRPLAEIAPGWRHPRLGLPVEALIAALPADQPVLPADRAEFA